MKIAILLRGQPRFSENSSKLFDILVKRQNPEIEFKVFAHAWNHISSKLIEDDNSHNEFIKFMSHDETYDLIKCWNPSKYRINSNNKTFTLIEQIISLLVDNKITSNPYINPQYEGFENNIDNYIERNKIQWMHIIISLLHSAILSFNLLEEYMLENPDYKPDIIISIRYDLLFKLNYKYFITYNFRDNFITVPSISVEFSGIGKINDNYLLSNYYTMSKYFRNGEQKIIDSYTKEPMMYIMNNGHMVEKLWSVIADYYLKFNYSNRLISNSIMRKNINLNDIELENNNLYNIVNLKTNKDNNLVDKDKNTFIDYIYNCNTTDILKLYNNFNKKIQGE